MRLQRIGRKNDASFRLIVTDSRRGPKSGKHIDLLGSYNPKMNNVQFNGEKIKEWIKNGVQVSPTVHNLLVSQKIIEGKKINVLPKKAPIIDEEALKREAEAKAKAEADAKALADAEAAAANEASGESEGTVEEPKKEESAA